MPPFETVLITGASAGVGRAVAQAFAKRGCTVGLLARSIEQLNGARDEVEAMGGRAVVLQADVADPAAVEAAAAEMERRAGPIDVWVNCAVAAVFAPFEATTDEEFRRVTEVAYLGYVHGTRAALRRMKPRNRGTIVQVGSALAHRAIPLQSAYCGAKHAIRGFTDSLRSELLHDGSAVRLTMVQLPAVNTPQFEWGLNRLPRHPQPIPPIHQPEPVAEAIVRAAEEAPRELWVGTPTLMMALGGFLMPATLDRVLARQGYGGQQMREVPADPDRPVNLFEPVHADYGTHGRFDRRARDEVATFSPGALGAILVAAAAALGFAVTGAALAVGRRIGR